MNFSHPEKAICIHQPDFMPWLGFFNKIAVCNEFVVLDHVMNNPRDGNWGRRVKMLIGGQANWITLPLVKPDDQVFVPINKMKIKLVDERLIKKILQSISINYSRASYFEIIFPFVESYFLDEDEFLASRNMKFISKICENMGLKKKMIYSSTLNCSEKATDLLIEICRITNANTYICGGGAAGYQEDEKFEQNGIKLVYQNFKHPHYAQFNSKEFVPGLSIIDALMNCGFDEVKKMISNNSQL